MVHTNTVFPHSVFLPPSFPVRSPSSSSVFFPSLRLHIAYAGPVPHISFVQRLQVPASVQMNLCKAWQDQGNLLLVMRRTYSSPAPHLCTVKASWVLAASTRLCGNATSISSGRKGRKEVAVALGLSFPPSCEWADWVWQGDKGQGFPSQPHLQVTTVHAKPEIR